MKVLIKFSSNNTNFSKIFKFAVIFNTKLFNLLNDVRLFF